VLFIDEAVFTSKQKDRMVWALKRSPSPFKIVNKLSFKAVAATVAIDVEGKVKAVHICDGAVNVDKFLEFLEMIRPGPN
jgi:hypothetical protein